MADEMDTLARLVQEVRHADDLPGPVPSVTLTDGYGYFDLFKTWTSAPTSTVPLRLPDDATIDALVEQMFPTTTPTSTADAVIAGIKAAIGGAGSLVGALGDLAALDWDARWQVVRSLGSSGPTLDGQTYLELAEPLASALPDLDSAVRAAVLGGLLALGGRTLGVDTMPSWIRLTELLLELDLQSQTAVLGHLGVPALAAEGTLAMMTSEALAAGMVFGLPPAPAPAPLRLAAPSALTGATPSATVTAWLDRLKQLQASINTARTDWEDWLQGRMPYGYYLGTQIHVAIGAYYRLQHLSHTALGGVGPLSHSNIWTNSIPMLTILQALQTKWAFQGAGIKQALAVSRPDIFEFGLVHDMPPGWVFEIKPASNGAGLAQAEAEVDFYTAVLVLCEISAIPGPVLAPGAEGVVPVAGGWVAFVCPVPGVIVYLYQRAPDEALEARGQVRVYRANRDRTRAMIAASGAAADVAKAGLLAAIFTALIDYGWVALFA